MTDHPDRKQAGPVWAGLGFSLLAGGVLVGATFLGDATASTGGAGTYALGTLPDNYGASDFLAKDRNGGTRTTQDGSYCYYYTGYYDCCYYTDSGDYCCYYYGYYYCYDSKPPQSGENLNEGNGFAAMKPARAALEKSVNVGGFTAVEKQAGLGTSDGFSGAGKPAGMTGYNNTFL